VRPRRLIGRTGAPRDPVEIAGPRRPGHVVVRPLNFTVRRRPVAHQVRKGPRHRLLGACGDRALVSLGPTSSPQRANWLRDLRRLWWGLAFTSRTFCWSWRT